MIAMFNRSPLSTRRFWSNVNIGERKECWEWKLYKGKTGYGRVKLNGKMYLVHRVAWSLGNGDIPDGMCVCHHCDNRACCNPAHLFVGTQGDNIIDMINKGGRSNSKITIEDVGWVRTWLLLGYTQQSIADAFGLTQTSISGIATGKKWSHV